MHPDYFHFSFPMQTEYLSFCSQAPFSWIRLLIKKPHTNLSLPCSTGFIWVPKPSALYDCVTDRLTLVVSPHPSVKPTVFWQAWLGQICWNKIWCPRATKREKWESVRCSLPCRSKKRESADIRSHYCKWSEKVMLCCSCLWQRSIEMSSISDWTHKKKPFNIFCRKKMSVAKCSYSNFEELISVCFFLLHLSKMYLFIYLFCFHYLYRTEKGNNVRWGTCCLAPLKKSSGRIWHLKVSLKYIPVRQSGICSKIYAVENLEVSCVSVFCCPGDRDPHRSSWMQ